MSTSFNLAPLKSVRARLENVSLAPVKSEPEKLERLNSDLCKLALVKLLLEKSPRNMTAFSNMVARKSLFWKTALLASTFEKSAPTALDEDMFTRDIRARVKSVLLNFVSRKSEPRRSVSLNFEPVNSTPFNTTLRFRQPAQSIDGPGCSSHAAVAGDMETMLIVTALHTIRIVFAQIRRDRQGAQFHKHLPSTSYHVWQCVLISSQSVQFLQYLEFV